MEMDLRFAHAIVGETALISCTGELDAYTIGPLKNLALSIEDSGVRRIVFDLRNVDYLSSPFLGLLCYLHKRTDGNVQLILVIICKQIRKVFHITGLDTVFKIVDTLEDAIGPELPFVRISCPIPACNGWTPPVSANELLKKPVSCADCGAEFQLSTSARTPMADNLEASNVHVWEFRLPTYDNEHIDVSFTCRAIWIAIVGKLDLFASESFVKAWSAIKDPERVVLGLDLTTRTTRRGLRSLLECYGSGPTKARPIVVANAETWKRLGSALAGLVEHYPSAYAAEQQLITEYDTDGIAPMVRIESVE